MFYCILLVYELFFGGLAYVMYLFIYGHFIIFFLFLTHNVVFAPRTHLGPRGTPPTRRLATGHSEKPSHHHRECQIFPRAHRIPLGHTRGILPSTPTEALRATPRSFRGACEEMPRHTILGVGHYRATSCHSMTVKPISLNPCHPAPGMMPRRHRDVTEEVPYQKTP